MHGLICFDDNVIVFSIFIIPSSYVLEVKLIEDLLQVIAETNFKDLNFL